MAYNQTYIIQFTQGLVPDLTNRYDTASCLFLARRMLEVRNKKKNGISCSEKNQKVWSTWKTWSNNTLSLPP